MPLLKVCKYCKCSFKTFPSRINKKFCSLTCKYKSQIGIKLPLEQVRKSAEGHKGAKSYWWKGGITPINTLIRNGLDYKLWRESIFKRDKFTCQECGDNRGRNLQAHHIKPFSDYPELRFAISNGITLCIECHKKTDTYLNRWNRYAKFA